MRNFILSTDSYKHSMAPGPGRGSQYPPRAEVVHSFFESRGGELADIRWFGLQWMLSEHFDGKRITAADIDEADEVCALHFGSRSIFNRAGWEHILHKHGGLLPLRICAVPEGSGHPVHTVLMTVENTDPECYWLTTHAETLLVELWYPATVTSQSRAMKAIILDALAKTGNPALIDFKLHDFGFRGSTSYESSAIGGAAHLVNFKGTDTMSALTLLRQHYDEPMAGFSIPAAEHSTITSWGKEREWDAYRNMLEQFPSGLVAVVSDSYDIFNACRKGWGGELKQMVGNRDGVLVVRPDSGHPPTVVVKVLEILAEAFSYHTNAKGYKILEDKIRVIQGDGIDMDMLTQVLDAMTAAGWSADNVAFGSGGGLLQKVNRDTLKFAFKASAIRIGQEWRDVMKDPVTDPGKKSKAGRFDTQKQLRPVFENGKMLIHDSLATIRERAAL